MARLKAQTLLRLKAFENPRKNTKAQSIKNKNNFIHKKAKLCGKRISTEKNLIVKAEARIVGLHLLVLGRKSHFEQGCCIWKRSHFLRQNQHLV